MKQNKFLQNNERIYSQVKMFYIKILTGVILTSVGILIQDFHSQWYPISNSYTVYHRHIFLTAKKF